MGPLLKNFSSMDLVNIASLLLGLYIQHPIHWLVVPKAEDFFFFSSSFTLTQMSKQDWESQHLVPHFLLHIIRPNLFLHPTNQSSLDTHLSKGGSPPFTPRPNLSELLQPGFLPESCWRVWWYLKPTSTLPNSHLASGQDCCPTPHQGAQQVTGCHGALAATGNTRV